MSFIETWATKFDPNQAPVTLFVFMVLVGTGVALWRLVWPWYTKEYWPKKFEFAQKMALAQLDVEKEQSKMLGAVRDALIEIKVIAGQQMILMQQHDLDSRNSLQTIMERQRAVLEKLGVSPIEQSPITKP